jgi:putative transposase
MWRNGQGSRGTKTIHRLREYVAHFHAARPHQGLRQRVPAAPEGYAPRAKPTGSVRAGPILGGLHHDYRRAS